MELIRTVAELRALLDPERTAGKQIGMVGTSGGMHQGHQSLVRQSVAGQRHHRDVLGRRAGRPVVVARGLDVRLRARLRPRLAARRGSRLRHPLRAAGRGDVPARPATTVTLPSFSSAFSQGGGSQLEDPAHLDLIALAMCKLWNMFGPCRNYFGEKDWQQLVMFVRLADDLEFPVEVLGCPTVRDDDGVAVSSRNSQLTPEQRAVAPVLYRRVAREPRRRRSRARRPPPSSSRSSPRPSTAPPRSSTSQWSTARR